MPVFSTKQNSFPKRKRRGNLETRIFCFYNIDKQILIVSLFAVDFIELGIEGVDKIVDQHFDKVPDSALHIGSYHPRNVKKLRKSNRRKNQRSSSPSSSSETEPEQLRGPRRRAPEMSQSPPRRGGTFSPADPTNPYASPPQYSREPPHLRPRYLPAPPLVGGGYYPPVAGGPPYSALDRRGRGFDDDDDDDNGNYYSDSFRRPSPARRPKAITRRSSSYHGPRTRGYDSGSEDDRQAMVLSRRRRDSLSSAQKERHKSHRHGLKEEIEKNFTKSPAGITGGALGAVLGGWAAKKAQTATGRDSKHKGSNKAVTLLGAAVGGLAVNAIIDKWEAGKAKTEEKEAKWEDKYGPPSDDESDGGRSGRGSRRDRRYIDDGDEYRGERGGKGYAPYDD